MVESALTRALRTVDELPSGGRRRLRSRSRWPVSFTTTRSVTCAHCVPGGSCPCCASAAGRPLPPYSEFDDALAIDLSHPPTVETPSPASGAHSGPPVRGCRIPTRGRGFPVSDSAPPSATSSGTAAVPTEPTVGRAGVKRGMAEMLKGGVIMDVVTPEQAKIAEDAGAVAVMALERVPADIRSDGGVARMSDPEMIAGIIEAVSIPVMAKARIGHFVEAQVLQALGVDYVDESEVLTPADEAHHIDKCAVHRAVRVRRHRPRGSAAPARRGRGDDPHQGRGRHRQRRRGRASHALDPSGIRQLRASSRMSCSPRPRSCARRMSLVEEVAEAGKLPVVLFTAGGIATPADAALMMQLGAEGVFVGSGIFKSGDPAAVPAQSSRRRRTTTTR